MFKIFNGQARGLGEQNQRSIYMQASVEFRAYLKYFKGSKLGVFMAISLHSDEQGWSFPTLALLAGETGYNETTISQTITDLCRTTIEGHRVLLCLQERDPQTKVFSRNKYLIFPTADEVRIWETENPDARKPRLGNPYTAQPEMEPSIGFPNSAHPSSAHPNSEDTSGRRSIFKENHGKGDPNQGDSVDRTDHALHDSVAHTFSHISPSASPAAAQPASSSVASAPSILAEESAPTSKLHTTGGSKQGVQLPKHENGRYVKQPDHPTEDDWSSWYADAPGLDGPDVDGFDPIDESDPRWNGLAEPDVQALPMSPPAQTSFEDLLEDDGRGDPIILHVGAGAKTDKPRGRKTLKRTEPKPPAPKKEPNPDDQLKRAILGWWKSDAPGQPGGAVTGVEAKQAASIVKIARQLSVAPDALVGHLQECYVYLFNQTDFKGNYWRRGRIKLGVVMSEFAPWWTQVKNVAHATPVVPEPEPYKPLFSLYGKPEEV